MMSILLTLAMLLMLWPGVALAEEEDTTPPEWASGFPKKSNISDKEFDLGVWGNENGTAYYVRLDDGATAPTAEQVAAGQDASGTSLSSPEKGSFEVIAAGGSAIRVKGLTPLTSYDVYTVLKDTAGNLQAAPTLVEVTTTSPSDTYSGITKVEPGVPGWKKVTVYATVKNADGIASRGYEAEDFNVTVDGTPQTFASDPPFSGFWASDSLEEPNNGLYYVVFTGDADNTEYTLTDLTVGGVVIEAGPYVIKTPPPALEKPSILAWDSTIPGKATWGAVANASSYRVQLYKGVPSSQLGAPVNVLSGTEHDFTSAITTAGSDSYTFTVTAIGDGTNFGNSQMSSASPTYDYTAPATDTTAPSFLGGYPKVGAAQPVGSKKIEVVFKANESGNSYYVILPTSASTPDGQKIKDYWNTKAGIDGVLCDGVYGYNHEVEEEHKITVSDDSLADNTSYKFCMVLVDYQNNVGIATPVTVTTPLPAPPTPDPAATATATAATLAPVANTDNVITLTVKTSEGNTDTTFTGEHNVTVSGVATNVSGTYYGLFDRAIIGAGGTLTKAVSFTAGVASLNLNIPRASEQIISFSIEGVDTPATNTLTITPVPGPPAVMTLTQDITAPTVNGGQFAQQPSLKFTDSSGNLCTNDSTTQVTASREDAGSWTLTGTTTVAAVNGIVTFADLGATNTEQVTGARIRFTPTAATNVYLSTEVTLPASDSVIVANALNAVENAAYSNMTQAAASSEDAIKAALRNTAVTVVNNSNVNVAVNKVIYAAPVAGTAANRSGTNGSYTFTVTVSKGAQSQTTTQKTITLTATAYTASSSGGGGGGGGTTPAGTLVTPTGTDVADNGVSLSIPAGAVENDIRVQVREASLTSGMDLPADSQLISQVVDIVKNKSGDFSEPVTITMSFNKSQIDPDKYDIKICYFDEANGEWVELDNIEVDPTNGSISGEVTHFTKFAVIATLKASEKEEPPLPPAPQPEPELPTDLAGHWAKDSIAKLINARVISGYPDGTFQPDKTISRAEFTVMLVKALKLEPKADSDFKDTAAHWARESIGTAAAHGLISGYDQNSFGPDDNITREQAAVIIARATQLETKDQTLNFTDAQQIASWALSGVTAAVNKSYLSGYPDNSFRPQGNTTRAEAAIIIAKLL